MARARNLKPAFFTNDLLAEIEPLGRLLFQGLWCLADREGRLVDRPKRIKAELLPYDDADVDVLLSALATRGFILRYECEGGRYIQVVKFAKHQNPHCKETASTLPAPDSPGARTMQAPEVSQTRMEVAGLIPDSGILIPDSPIPFPDPPNPAPRGTTHPSHRSGRIVPERRQGPTSAPTATALVANAFCEAYLQRYGGEFRRSAKSMGQFRLLMNRIGAEDASAVAAFYVGSNHRWYVERGHNPDCLLKDAEKLHTEWRTGRRTSASEAQLMDRTQGLGNVFGRLIDEIREAANG